MDHHSRQPAWKRIQRSPFFWIAAVCIAIAMIIYVTTGNLAVTPAGPAQRPVPAAVP